jgi:hypothetical protein
MIIIIGVHELSDAGRIYRTIRITRLAETPLGALDVMTESTADSGAL